MPSETSAGYIGNLVVARREELGLTQEQVATAAKISVSGLFNIESGKSEPKLSTIVQLCEALQWTPESVNRLRRGQKPIVGERPPAISDDQRTMMRIAIALERIASALEKP